jgi:hypothetical protein
MATATLEAALAGTLPVRRVTMARATLDDGQVVDAVNDLFVGVQSHASARYRLEWRNRREEQSSGGVIFSDGMEQDFIRFDAGMRARITVADDRQLALVWPASRGRPD